MLRNVHGLEGRLDQKRDSAADSHLPTTSAGRSMRCT